MLSGLTTVRNNLPAEVSSFIGRERELGEIARLLRAHRLVTLTGAGGTGKTRLALRAATAAVEEFADGVCLVELAAVTTPELVIDTLLTAVGAPAAVSTAPLDALAAFLGQKHLLLLLDNCEHLLDACARLVAGLLARCPALTVLATSREPLAIAGEWVLRVPPLTLPDVAQPLDLERLLTYDAICLFVERTQAAEPSFHFSAVSATPVVDICRRLDGIPLALELAAGRVRGMGVAYLGARLDERFRLLTSSDRTAAPRQQTLQAMIDWSYDLLPEVERVVLRRLGVFVGSFSLEAAEIVCAGEYVGQGGPATLAADAVLNHLAQLVNKSLVQLDHDTTRYRLLESIRLYASQRLAEAGETQHSSRQHLAWYLEMCEQGAALIGGPSQHEWFTRLEQEHDNLRAALAWAVEEKRPDEAARLGLAIWRFWHTRIYQREGLRWLEQILALAATNPLPGDLRPRLFNALGVLAHSLREFDHATTYHGEALRLWRTTGDQAGMAQALIDMGWQAFDEVKVAEAKRCVVESLSLAERTSDKRLIASALYLSTLLELHVVDSPLFSFGTRPETDRSPPPAIITTIERCLSLWHELGDTSAEMSTRVLLGIAYQGAGDYERAKPLLAESARLYIRLGAYGSITGALVALMILAANTAERPEMARDAARMFGFLSGLAQRLAAGPSPWDSAEPSQRMIKKLVGVLGHDDFDQAFIKGKGLTTAELLALVDRIAEPALHSAASQVPAPAGIPHGDLTPREREVLRLVATGLTNSQIAERLTVTPRTVNAHLTAIYSKIGVLSRASAIRYALEHQLG
jgi:non-specific serine/threonine protein kinase